MHMPQLGELRRVSLTLSMVKANPKVRRVPIDRSHAVAFQKLPSAFDEGEIVRRCIVTTPLNSMLQSIVSAVVTDIDNAKIARRNMQVLRADVDMLGDATFRDHQRRLTDELACERNRVKALEMKWSTCGSTPFKSQRLLQLYIDYHVYNFEFIGLFVGRALFPPLPCRLTCPQTKPRRSPPLTTRSRPTQALYRHTLKGKTFMVNLDI
ncbi:hypothetical protein DYB37_010191 [Aphanomyces astaci]|uniref:Uncharacterized protein n=1 Tax=Aphanomyces astaci TaxID=112090 RepID=A0A3R7ESG6_APHAT|nr:hypothetical protein DYB35_009394 [Aphanomyces astaci]RHZ12714.1 hypothetical protein DYB37_010191 [Aphanomyces astaci]